MSNPSIRHKEQILLKKMLESDRPELLALYGRRRIGKTHLIRDYFEGKKGLIFFDVAGAQNAPMQEQIANFTARIEEVFTKGLKLAQGKNWNDTFRTLTQALQQVEENKNIIIFFDEFPWMATKNSRLLQSLDYYWNQYWSKDARIKLVVCGSSASWIIEKIVNNKGGLHNRVTRQIHLQPFTLKQTKQFLKSQGITLNIQQILTLYMATGGIPYYLMNIESGQSAAQAIESLAFTKGGILLNEFDNLYSSLFEQHDVYERVVRFVAKNRYGLERKSIIKHLGTEFSGKRGLNVLQALVDSGFLIQFKPYQNKRRGIYYRVIDEYSIFYLKWIEPLKDTLAYQSLDPGYWRIQQQSPSWQSWSGYAFESVCYKHIAEIKSALKLSPIDIPNTWRYVPSVKSQKQGAQIDLLFDRQDGIITLGEIKCNDTPFVIDKSYAQQLQNKIEVFQKQTRTKKQLFMTMITVNGIKPNPYSDVLISGVVTIEDFFN